MSSKVDFINCVLDDSLKNLLLASERTVFRFGNNLLINKKDVIYILTAIRKELIYIGFTKTTSSLINSFAFEVLNEVLQSYVDCCIKNINPEDYTIGKVDYTFHDSETQDLIDEVADLLRLPISEMRGNWFEDVLKPKFAELCNRLGSQDPAVMRANYARLVLQQKLNNLSKES